MKSFLFSFQIPNVEKLICITGFEVQGHIWFNDDWQDWMIRLLPTLSLELH